MMRMFSGLAVVLALLAVPVQANEVQKSWKKAPVASPVQNPDKTFTPGADLDTIRERGWIEFGVYDDFKPYSWVEGGEVIGTDVELGRIIAEELGVEARFRLMQADENVDSDLRNYVWKGPLVGPDRNVVNVMLHVPWDRELDIRNELIVLTGKYMVEQVAIAYAKAHYPDGGPVPAYFRFDTVGVENDSIADFYLSNLANGQLLNNISRFPTVDAAMEALKRREIMAVTGPLTQLQGSLDDGIAVHTPPMPGLSRGTWTLGVSVRHNYRRLGYAVDDAIAAAIADGRLAAAFAKFGASYTVPER